MIDDQNNPTRSHAKLGDELLAILRDENGWLSSHTLLQRCELAKSGEQLALTLAPLVVATRIQAHSDRLGLLYAMPGLPVPADRVRDARGPSSNAESLIQSEPRPLAPVAAIHQVNAQQRQDAARAQMVEMFQAQPLRSRSEFDAALGRSQPIVSRYLRAMREEGLIKPVGKGRMLKFRWVGDADAGQPVATAPPISSPVRRGLPSRDAQPGDADAGQPVATEPPISSPVRRGLPSRDAQPGDADAGQPVATAPPISSPVRRGLPSRDAQPEPTDPAVARFALWSDGQFQIDRGADCLRLSQADTHLLAAFLAATHAKDLVFAP